MSKTMKAIEISTPGGPEVLVPCERPMPTAGQGEVVIRVAWAGVNRPDALQRAGNYAPPPTASDLPGLEASGEVAEVGPGVTDWKLGDKICALLPGGGYAEYVTTPAAHCLPLPEGMDLREAACLPETFFTVWTNVFMRGGLKAGERFLVHGGLWASARPPFNWQTISARGCSPRPGRTRNARPAPISGRNRRSTTRRRISSR